MRLRRALAGALLAATALATPAGAAVTVRNVDISEYPTVKVGVTTSAPSRATPRLLEGGLAVAGLRAQNLGSQKSVVLVIDRSQSMKGKPLSDALAAARSFVAARRPGDSVGVVIFGSRTIRLARLSTSGIDADLALRSVGVDDRPGTALYDAIGTASRMLGAEASRARVMVLLTDGSNQAGTTSFNAALAAARRAGVAVHSIGIAGTQFEPGPLQQLARGTGGSYRATRFTSELRSLYAALGAELARTWLLEYVTAARPGDTLALRAVVPGHGAAQSTLQLPGDSVTVDPAPRLLPGLFYGSAAGSLIAGLIVGLLVLAAATLGLTAARGARLRRRLAPHLADAPKAKIERERERLAVASGLFRATERAFAHLDLWHRLGRLIERADLPWRTVELVYMSIGVGFFLGLFMAVTARPSWMILAGMVGGGALPIAFVWAKGKRRLAAFENQLPDLLIAVAASLKAGHSFKHALATTVEEGKPPASKELRRVLTEARLGRPMDEALADMARRVGSKNFEFVITSVSIQTQVGGSLAGLIDMVADTVRQRQQFARKIKGLTAMGRAGAYVLMGLPFILAGAITLINPGYMDSLYHTSTGHTLIYIGLGMMAFGSLILRQIVSFKG